MFENQKYLILDREQVICGCLYATKVLVHAHSCFTLPLTHEEVSQFFVTLLDWLPLSGVFTSLLQPCDEFHSTGFQIKYMMELFIYNGFHHLTQTILSDYVHWFLHLSPSFICAQQLVPASALQQWKSDNKVLLTDGPLNRILMSHRVVKLLDHLPEITCHITCRLCESQLTPANSICLLTDV